MNRNLLSTGILFSIALFLVGCSDSRKAEIEKLKSEVETAKDAAIQARGEADTARFNLESARSEAATAKLNLDKARSEVEALRAQLGKPNREPVAAPDAVEKDLKQLQGIWYLVEGEYSGRRETWKGQSLPVKMLIEGKRFTFVLGTKIMEGTFELDCASEPHSWTWKFTSGEPKGSITPQLYKLVDGDLFTCQTSSKPERLPSNFVAGTGSDQQITRWSRTNPAGPLAAALCEQTGTFFLYSDKKEEERTTNFPMPYDLPPNVAISGPWGSSVIVKEVTATGFKWRTTNADRSDASAIWTAKGIAATKLPKEGK
jgi:uncharacterized protein (TIGR03067 family)